MKPENSLTIEEILEPENVLPESLADAVEEKQTIIDEYIRVAPDARLYIRDCGEGKPVILVHGWPLCSDMWEYQVNALVNNGCRVIAYDRRGFGKSSQPWSGYDYDTMTNDLKAIIDHLKLEHITLVGFSMGGGEVVRYFSRHGGAKVSKAILISSVTPFQLKTSDNPTGNPEEMLQEILTRLQNDRIGFLEVFGKAFFGVTLINHPVSNALLNYYCMLGSIASHRATAECAKAFFTTDFRKDMATVNVPTLIVHGGNDKTVSIESSSDISAAMIPLNEYIVYEDAPHGLFYTHRERLNADLVKFINS